MKIDLNKLTDTELLARYKMCEILFQNYDNLARANEGFDSEAYERNRRKCNYYYSVKQNLIDEMEIRLGAGNK